MHQMWRGRTNESGENELLHTGNNLTLCLFERPSQIQARPVFKHEDNHLLAPGALIGHNTVCTCHCTTLFVCCSKVFPPSCTLGGSAFSAVTCNLDFVCPPHRDSHNDPELPTAVSFIWQVVECLSGSKITTLWMKKPISNNCFFVFRCCRSTKTRIHRLSFFHLCGWR
jgi:hypothetical protein